MKVLVMLGFIGIIFSPILVAIILGAIKLRTFFIHLSIKYMENRKHLAIYLAIHVAVSFVFCCIAFLCYEKPFSRDVGVLIAALSITGCCAVLVLTYFSLLFSRKNWIISFVFLICGILSGIAGFKSVEFSVEYYHVVEKEQTKCVGCGKWIENKGIAAYFNSEWEARGYCSAECRNEDYRAKGICTSCHKPKESHPIVTRECWNSECRTVIYRGPECPTMCWEIREYCRACREEEWRSTKVGEASTSEKSCLPKDDVLEKNRRKRLDE